MSKSQDKLHRINRDLKEFLTLSQDDRINVIQAIILDSITELDIEPGSVSKLARAYLESTTLRKENRLEFSKQSPDSLREEEDE